jgi:hypothetical protein
VAGAAQRKVAADKAAQRSSRTARSNPARLRLNFGVSRTQIQTTIERVVRDSSTMWNYFRE